MPTDHNQDQQQNQQNTDQSKDQNPNNQTQQIADFEAWIGTQPAEVKTSFEGHIAGLKSSLKATRDENTTYKNSLQDALKKVEKGSEAEKALQDSIEKLNVAEKRANFFEDAIKPEIGCRNPKVAFAVATAENLFDGNGSPNWAALKKTAPELFGVIIPKSKGGNGTEEDPPKPVDMNTIIRRAAGAPRQ
jgi:hypothetical protein